MFNIFILNQFILSSENSNSKEFVHLQVMRRMYKTMCKLKTVN